MGMWNRKKNRNYKRVIEQLLALKWSGKGVSWRYNYGYPFNYKRLGVLCSCTISISFYEYIFEYQVELWPGDPQELYSCPINLRYPLSCVCFSEETGIFFWKLFTCLLNLHCPSPHWQQGVDFVHFAPSKTAKSDKHSSKTNLEWPLPNHVNPASPLPQCYVQFLPKYNKLSFFFIFVYHATL